MTEPVTSATQRRIRRTVILLAMIVATIFGLFIFRQWYFIHQGRRTPPDLADYHGVIYPRGQAIGPFALRSVSGKAFSAADLLGHWTFVLPGDSRCGATCDQVLDPLRTLLDRIDPRWPRPRLVVVDDDPDFDRPAILAGWSRSLGGQFRVVTGPEEQIRRLMQALKHGYIQGETRKAAEPPTLALINPAGRLQALFRPPYEADLLAAGYIRTVHWYRDGRTRHR